MLDQQVLSSSRAWCATPTDYNSLIFVRFRADGSGDMTFGYGQTIYAKIQIHFEIAEQGRMTIKYLRSDGNKYVPSFQPAPGCESKTISYSLKQGEVTGQAANSGPFTFHWTLKLSDSPFPEGLTLPDITYFRHTVFSPPREYYGHNADENPC